MTALIRSGRSRSRRSARRAGARRRRRWDPARRCSRAVPSAARKNAALSETRWACCMLWVTITTVTSPASAPIVSSTRRVDVGSRAKHGSSISSTSGRRQGPGDAQPLLLAAGQRRSRRCRAGPYLVPEARARRLCSTRSSDPPFPAGLRPRELQPCQTLSATTCRIGLGLLEDHADPTAALDRPAAGS